MSLSNVYTMIYTYLNHKNVTLLTKGLKFKHFFIVKIQTVDLKNELATQSKEV